MQQLEYPPSSMLPAQLTPLLGRDEAVASVCALLQRQEVRLLTLTGPGGIGKTRLALQSARELRATFADGVFFVPLALVSDPEQVMPAIAQALGLRETGDWPLLERLYIALREKRLLLLLDNFEQVTAAAPRLLELLAQCPQVKLLVTSRAVLHLRGEYEFAVAPLALPDPERLTDSATLAQSAAVALFVQRAQALKPDFQVTPANARAIVEICQRLDGLPLAIELAAARIKLLPPQALLTRLEDRLHVLTSAAQDAPARQQTLRDTLSWSYDLLDAEEQRLFRRLSVFVAGCTLEAAEAVMGTLGNGERSVLDGAASLIDQSLLQQREQPEHEPRLVMLETIREYGWECLRASGEAAALQQAHAAYYLALAEEAEPNLRVGGQEEWLERLEREHENLRAALRWLEEQGEREQALRLSGALWWFWWVRGHARAGRAFLERMLASGAEISVGVRAKALNAAGALASLQGQVAQAERLCQEALPLFRQLGDAQGVVNSLWILGYATVEQGQFAQARAFAEEAVSLARTAEYPWGLAYALEILANVFFNQGDYPHARALAEESLMISRAIGDTAGSGLRLRLLGMTRLFQGDPDAARPLFAESLARSHAVGDRRGSAYALIMGGYTAIVRGELADAAAQLGQGLALLQEVGDRRGMAWGLYGLGWVALSHGDAAQARLQWEETLTLLREVGQQWFIALTLEGLALASTQEQPLWSARLWGAAEHLRETIGGSIPALIQTFYEPFLALGRSLLGESMFAAAWAEGRTLALDAVLGAEGRAPLAQSPQPAKVASAARPVFPAGLTAREVDVLKLIAQGLTDNQVAEQLVISPRTVSTHLTSIYNKLGVSSRAAATRFAVEHQLV
ncbi:MAG TPA: LuxR C-terminal-related transcriptional regulator [Ktedonobacterales bacterium]|nr:LuxR C-terminal-related transcriptional regulator [Ktedonobacterales bacterium]